jgi:hypothetical protein
MESRDFIKQKSLPNLILEGSLYGLGNDDFQITCNNTTSGSLSA